MRVSTAPEEKFGQGNDRGAGRTDALPGLAISGTGSWGQDSGLPERLLQPNGRRARKHVLAPGASFPPEGVIGGVLGNYAAEVSFGTEYTGSHEGIQSEVVAFRAFQRVVAFVTNVRKAGAAHTRWQRQ